MPIRMRILLAVYVVVYALARGGAAGGVKITPVGFLVIREGTVRMLPIATPANTTADRLVEQVPDVLGKITAFIDTRIEKKGE